MRECLAFNLHTKGIEHHTGGSYATRQQEKNRK